MINYADVIAALVAVALFLAFFYGPWQGIMVDYARQISFEERDAVFDLAASGKLDFNSHDYRVIRDAFNNLIRFAHEMSWTRLVLHGHAGSTKKVSDVHLAVDRIENPETRQKVTKHLQRARYALLIMVGAKSLLLAPSIGLAMAVSWCMGKTRTLFRKLDAAYGESMQCEAEGA
ncbi:hypothetical protein [Bradyrhizobium ivorense]|uniref:hypothetical protein n=1 Tax=Bradyrhizobium ivorense TaxID=2511166 RepID=UPI0010B7A8BE|nr:hypothetical protein [Bradyrhizobium ivorense]VIO78555.1 hypothetical protein CI41S_63960 [Bradyrhizobium ivorense]